MSNDREPRNLKGIRRFLAEKRVCRVAVNTRAPFRAMVNAGGYDQVHNEFSGAPDAAFQEGQPEEAYVADIRFLGVPDQVMTTADVMGFCQQSGSRPITIRELIALNTQFSREPSIYELPALGTTFQREGRQYIARSMDIPDIGGGVCGEQMVRRAIRHGYRGFERHLDIAEFDRVWPFLTILPVVDL